MRNLILLLLTYLTFSVSYSQVYYDESNFENYLDYDKNYINLVYKDYAIKGVFQKWRGKDYKNYLLVEGEANIHYVIKINAGKEIYGIDIIKGSYEDVLKGFKRGRKYSKKTEVLFTNLPSDSAIEDLTLISEFMMKYEAEKKKKKESEDKAKVEFLEEFKNSGFEGVYDIQILRNNTLDYSKIETFGKLYITDTGISIMTDIPSIDLIRGTYNYGQNNLSEGSLICKISKGYGDTLSLSLNFGNTTKVGAFSVLNGSRVTTTTFKVID